MTAITPLQRHRSSIELFSHCWAVTAALVFSLWCGSPWRPSLSSTATAEDSPSPAIDERPLDSEDREHWAFRRFRTVDVPPVGRRDWPLGPIDAFILAKQESLQLSPLVPADRATLLRRVTFDLTGLPPTIAEQDAWLREDGPDGYERLVDRLLASPSLGIHAAQRWLDLARFAETDGFEHDHERPQAWRYRDWVVDTINGDMPYTEFLRRQIAGDLLEPGDPRAAIATGFLLCGPDMPDLNSQDERRHQVLNEITSTVGAVMLGLQFGCAECHDHKVDPLSSGDFYRLRAFFEPLDIFKDHPLTDGTKAARVVREGAVKESRLWLRGDFRRPGPVVSPEFPRIANTSDRTLGEQPADRAATSPRAALANWLTDPLPPLAARVIVNRVWQDHFGRALAGSPSDLGLMGEAPSHGELLEWLAAEWPGRSGSLKELRRALVTSATYRQASRVPRESSASEPAEAEVAAASENLRRARRIDSTNRWLVGMNRRRLEGEAIRDALLAVSGQLDHSQGGPGVRPPLPAELTNTLLKNQWSVSPREADHRRRSIYLFVRRNLRFPLLDVFDRPDPNAPCPTRNVSTTAPQALSLMNSTSTLAAARALAEQLRTAADEDARRTDLMLRTLVGRPASADDRHLVTDYLRTVRADDPARASDDDPWVDLVRALMNSNEFIYID